MRNTVAWDSHAEVRELASRAAEMEQSVDHVLTQAARAQSLTFVLRATAYLYAGSEPSLTARLFEDAERPPFGQAQPMTLTPLPPPEPTLAALSERLDAEGPTGGEALGELVVFTAGGHDVVCLPALACARRRRER